MPQFNLSWNPEHFYAVFILFYFIVAYIIYWFIAKSPAIKQAFEKKFGPAKAAINIVIFQKSVGTFLIGIVPSVLLLILLPYRMDYYGLSLHIGKESGLWIAVFAILLPLMNLFSTKKPEQYAVYPEIRSPKWSGALVTVNTVNWMAYLLAYELMFRGFLLVLLVPVLGVWPAIAVNTVIYSAVHIPKGVKEAVGAIPLGIVLCYLTLKTGTIWVAFFAHVFLALSNDYFSILNNPDMKYISRKASRS